MLKIYKELDSGGFFLECNEVSRKGLENMLDNLAIGNKKDGVKYLINALKYLFEISDKDVFNEKVGLYKIKKDGDDWLDDAYDDDPNINSFDGAILDGLDLSKINYGLNIKNEFKKISLLNSNLKMFYNNNIKNLKNHKLYEVESTKNGLNNYKPLTRSELVSLGFWVEGAINTYENTVDYALF